MDEKTEKFVKRAISVHGNQYDYSKVYYTRAIDKVKIICKKHGVYNQQPAEHIRGRGCRSCGFERVSTDDFIKNSQKVHGERYDYSKSNFLKSHIKTVIRCKIHGDFQISPNQHQNGGGCPSCSKLELGKKKAANAGARFLEKAKAVHHDTIDFTKTVYITAKEKAIFICPIHGEWEARPDNILHGKGCPGCRRQKIIDANTQRSFKAGKEFARKAKNIHHDKYNYNKSKYISVHEKIKIICPDHGVFWQSPANHLSGENGCPDCSIFGYRTSKPGWLYLQTLNEEFIKIGVTNHTPERRMKEHIKNSSLEHKIIGKWHFDDGNTPLSIETTIKRAFECGVVSPNIMKDGHSETMCISDLPKALEMIRNILNNTGVK
jgi:hypothetical protein